MKRRKSAIVNLPTSGLFVRLEQYEKELLNLKQIQLEQKRFIPAQHLRITQIEDTMFLIKKVIIERYLNDDISLNKIALLFLNSTGAKADVYQEVFVGKIIKNQGWIEQNILKKVINKLSIENLIKISCCQKEIPNKNLMRNYILEEYHSQEISEVIKNLELEDIWFVSNSGEEDMLYKLVKSSINEILYHVPEEMEDELLEKIRIDEKEGMKDDKYKRKRKVK